MDNNPNTDTTPKTGQVMDIQPSSPTVSAPVPETAPVEAAPAAQPENTEVATPPVDTAPTAEAQTTEAPADQSTPLAAAAPISQHKKPLVPVIVAIVIGLALIGVAGFAYMNQDKTPAPTTSSQNPAPQVTAADVDATNKAVDDSLATTNNAVDFDDATLSDAALAL